MPGWFSTTKRSSARPVDAEPQPFQVNCGCGQTLPGHRRRRHQVLECDACRAAVFVLPADVYPPIEIPAERRRKKLAASKKRRRREATVADPVVEAESPEPAPVEVEPNEPAGDATALTAPPVRKPFFTPLRGILLAMLLIVSLTVWWAVRSRMLDAAARDVQKEREAAHAALEAGNLPQAAVHFRNAWAALQQLGKEEDAAAQQTHQWQRETHAATNLASQPLMDIVEEARPVLAAAGNSETAQEDAPTQSLGHHRGSWIVMDATLIPIAAAEGTTRWIVDYPFAVGAVVVEIDANLPVLTPFQSAAEPQRVLFAAQLDACRLESGRRLIVQLEQDSAFLWKNLETLEMIGLVAPDEQARSETKSLLERQAQTAEAAP